jgi:hypothetical protein
MRQLRDSFNVVGVYLPVQILGNLDLHGHDAKPVLQRQLRRIGRCGLLHLFKGVQRTYRLSTIINWPAVAGHWVSCGRIAVVCLFASANGRAEGLVTQASPVLLTFLLGIQLSCVGFAAAADPLLDQIRTANRISVDSIHTLYCRFVSTYTSRGATTEPEQGEYWRDGGVVRLRSSAEGKTVDSVAKDAVVRTLGRGNGRVIGTVVPLNGRPLATCDVWSLGLLGLPDPKRGFELVSFDELIGRGQQVGQVSEKKEFGRNEIVVEVITPDSKWEVWFDAAVNYLIRRIIVTQDKKRTDVSVTRFAETMPGLFFPEQVEMRMVVDGKPGDSRSTVFTDVRVNEPLSPSVFDFHFPAGLEVTDLVMGKTYITDADGRPGGQIKDLEIGGAPPYSPAPKDVTKDEAKPWSNWILPGSLGILGGAGALWLRSRWLTTRPS